MTGYQFLAIYIIYIVGLFLVYRYIKKRIRLKAERKRAEKERDQTTDIWANKRKDQKDV